MLPHPFAYSNRATDREASTHTCFLRGLAVTLLIYCTAWSRPASSCALPAHMSIVQLPVVVDAGGTLGSCDHCGFNFCILCEVRMLSLCQTCHPVFLCAGIGNAHAKSPMVVHPFIPPQPPLLPLLARGLVAQKTWHGDSPCDHRDLEALVREYLEADEAIKAALEKRYGRKTIQTAVANYKSEKYLKKNSKVYIPQLLFGCQQPSSQCTQRVQNHSRLTCNGCLGRLVPTAARVSPKLTDATR